VSSRIFGLAPIPQSEMSRCAAKLDLEQNYPLYPCRLLLPAIFAQLSWNSDRTREVLGQVADPEVVPIAISTRGRFAPVIRDLEPTLIQGKAHPYGTGICEYAFVPVEPDLAAYQLPDIWK
jgi:hypothetical protein